MTDRVRWGVLRGGMVQGVGCVTDRVRWGGVTGWGGSGGGV